MASFYKAALCVSAIAALGSAALIPEIAQAATANSNGSSLFKASESAVLREKSVQVVSTTSNNQLGATPNVAATVTIVTDAARGEGIQHISFEQAGSMGQETIELIGGAGYFRGDAFTLQNFNGFTASAAQRYAGTWLKVTHSDAAYSKVTSGLTIASMPAQMVLPQPQLLPSVSTLDGYNVRQLRSVFQESSGTVTGLMYIRSRGTPLPVEQTFTQQDGSHGTDTWSHWNEPVTIKTPVASTLFSATGQ
jgi:hypothetical protein